MGTSARLDELKRKFDENPRRYFAPLANEYRKQGDTTQAISLCRNHLPNQPGHISGHIVLAQALYESRELVESRQMFEAALQLDPENLIALRYLGDISREQGSPAEAQAWYKRVLEFDPRNEEISQLLADVGQAADVAIAELSSQPTPPSGIPVFESEETPHTGVAAAPEEPEPVVEALNEGPELSSMVLEEQVAEPVQESELVEEMEAPSEIDLYGGDPSGDDWRASIGAPATPSQGLSLDTDEVLGLNQESQDLGELEAIAEPSSSDWFAATPAPHAPPVLPVDDAVVEDSEAAPDDDEVAQDVDVAFGWPASESESSEEVPERVEVNASDDTIIADEAPEFAGWSSSEEPEAQAEAPRPVVDAWGSIDLPAISQEFQDIPQTEQSDEEPYAVSGGFDQSQAFDANDAASLVEESPYDPSEYGEDESYAATSESASLEPAGEAVSESEPVESEPSDDFVTADTGADSALVVDDGSGAYDAFGELDDIRASSDLPDAYEAGIPDPLIGRTPSFVPSVTEEPPAPFVTETMAELYLQQGFNEEALAVYRQLLARNPDDPALAERVRQLEGGESEISEVLVSAPEPTVATESARSFFARFANRQVSGGQRGNALESAGPAAATLTVPLAGAAMPDEALTRPDEPTLTHIFSGQVVPTTDAEAASTLASAFGGAVDQVPAGELSLERLFRDVPAHSSGAVTLDESGGNAATTSSQQQMSAEESAEGEAPADYEQFTAWLEGLKKK